MDDHNILVALRDFFAARNGCAMVAACEALAKANVPMDETSSPVEPTRQEMSGPQSADDLEYAFNRLFVGPESVTAPPYASVYLDGEHRLMDQATRTASGIYETLGLSSPLTGSQADDHLALELDAVLAFRALGGREQSAEITALWDYFLHEHLVLWVPQFVSRVLEAQNVPPAVLSVMSALSAWLSRETRALTREPIPTTHQTGDMA